MEPLNVFFIALLLIKTPHEAHKKNQKLWLQFHAQAMEEHTWMVWLLMEALSVSAIPVLVVLIAPNFHLLLVLLMLTGMHKTIYALT